MKKRNDPTKQIVYICAGCWHAVTKIIAKHLTPPHKIDEYCARCECNRVFTLK